MKYLILIILVILVSCADISGVVTTSKYIVRSEISFEKPGIPIHLKTGEYASSIGIGEWITYIDDVDKFAVSYPADYPKDFPSSMGGMSIERDATSCAPEVIGISQPNVLATDANKEKTIWGRMDYRELFGGRGGAFLDPPAEYSDICRPQSGDAMYAFCSEEVGDPGNTADDKRVVICVSQQIDNPRTVADIFSTFRWTDTPESSTQENLEDFTLWSEEMIKRKREFFSESLSPFSLALPDDSNIEQYGNAGYGDKKEITVYHPEQSFSFSASIFRAKEDESLQKFVQDYQSNTDTWNDGSAIFTFSALSPALRNEWMGIEPNTVALNLPLLNEPYEAYEGSLGDPTFSIEPDTMLLFTKKDSNVLMLAFPFARKDDVFALIQ